jgi:ribosome-binding factor A
VSRRQDRVADLLRTQLSQILLRDLEDPRVRLASVTTVDISPDLRHARVGISILGDDSERQEGIRALTRARGFLRRRLAGELRSLRAIPDLEFELDRGAEYSQHISDLLDQLDDSDPDS